MDSHKFRATGSVNKVSKKAETPRSGRKLSARALVNLNAVRESVGKSPKKSLRRFSREMDLSIHVLHCRDELVYEVNS